MTTLKPAADLFAIAAWRVVWVTIPFVALLNLLYGGALDWVRLGLFIALTAGAQWWSRRSSTQALTAHTAGSILIEFFMVADPSGVLNRLGLRDLGFVALAGLGVFGVSAQSGWRGAVGTGGLAFAGLLLLHLYFGGQYLLFGSGLLLALAYVGVGIHTIYARLERANERLESLAMLDPLTGLENRRALEHTFERQVAIAARRAQPLLLTSWDLNNLKRVNDTHGHAAGDAHLCNFAAALKAAARLEDACFRIGGDEFVGLHIGLHDGVALARRVRKRFPAVAAGWIVVTGDGTLSDALERADRAMYVNKEAMQRSGTHATLETLTATGSFEARPTLVLEESRRPKR